MQRPQSYIFTAVVTALQRES